MKPTPAFIFRLYWLAILLAVLYLLLRSYGGFLPVGAVGQPRAKSLAADWHVPWQLMDFYLAAFAALMLASKYPEFGFGAYLALDFALPVHSPEWIYTRAVGLTTIAALLALAALVLFRMRQKDRLWPPMDAISVLLLAFVAWNLFCDLVARTRPETFLPALQFHPIHLLQGLAMFYAVRLWKDQRKALTIVAVSVAFTLVARTMIYGVIFKDAGIASDVAITLPLVCYLATSRPSFLVKTTALAISLAALPLLLYVQNRGALIGIACGGILALLTARHRWIVVGTILTLLVAVSLATNPVDHTERLLPQKSIEAIWKNNDRIVTWRAGVAMAWDHPLLGVGPGRFVHHVGVYQPDIAGHSAHNLLVDIVSESGFVGLAIYLCLFGTVIFRCIRNMRRNSCQASRWTLVSLTVFAGCGMFITTTMFTLPYILFAIPTLSETESSETATAITEHAANPDEQV